MLREAHGLFPMAERLLTPDREESVRAGFDELHERAGITPAAIRSAVEDLRRQAGIETTTKI